MEGAVEGGSGGRQWRAVLWQQDCSPLDNWEIERSPGSMAVYVSPGAHSHDLLFPTRLYLPVILQPPQTPPPVRD